jgi:hypothetical protein
MARHCYVVAQQKPSLKLNLTRSNCCLVVEQLHHSVESSFFFLTFSSHTGCMSRESDFNHNRRTPFPPRSRPKARRGKLGRKRRALFPQYKYGMRRASPDPLPQYRTQSGECARRPQLLEHITSEEILRERVPFPFWRLVGGPGDFLLASACHDGNSLVFLYSRHTLKSLPKFLSDSRFSPYRPKRLHHLERSARQVCRRGQ